MNTKSRLLKTKGNKITSKFGMRTITYTSGPSKGQTVTKNHNGIDIVGEGSTLDYIVAHTGGTVKKAGFDSSVGYFVTIDVGSGVEMVYYHMKEGTLVVKSGQKVSAGDTLGYMGATGNVTGAHLHFGIKVNGSWIDPELYINSDYFANTSQKGGLTVDIVKNFVTNNMHYKNNRIIDVKRLVLHSVGCPQPNPDVFVKNWNSSSNKYLTQLVIGAEKVYEVLPCLQTKGKAVFCWHVGNANSNSIGAEMTEPSTIKYTGGANWTDLNPEKTKAHVLSTYKNAVATFAKLCIFHDLDPLLDGIILSHSECHARGIGTNHGDVEHIWKKFGLSMDQFRQDVKAAMGGVTPVIKPSNSIFGSGTIKVGSLVKLSSDAVYYSGKFIPEWVKKQNWYVSAISGDRVVINKSEDGKYAINSPVNAKYVSLSTAKESSFMVKVTATNLNIRTGPATSYPRISYIPVGVYTIVETNGNWGRLKSKQTYNGAKVDGWISLNYAKKI